jgi:AhpD family alkylhydroperoxidase
MMAPKLALSLRAAVGADWPAIEALLIDNGLPTAGARQHLHTFLVAMHEGKVVGVAGAEIYGQDALLRSVAVAPALHGQGIGERILTQLLLEAARRDIAHLFLLTETAADYFTRFGFHITPREQAPPALQASAEFQGACPASATLMVLTLRAARAVDSDLPVAVIGAGPVGLAAVARLVERGMAVLLFEAGSRVGANLVDYGHVKLFSPWRYNVEPTMAAMLEAHGWQAPPPDELPAAGEVVTRVLEPFAALPAVASTLHLDSKVVAITREGHDKLKSAGRDGAPFILRVVEGGVEREYRARAVIDASGTWSTPNPLGANGLPALGERDHGDAIVYGIPDVLGSARERYAGKRTLVVGAGHSAANSLLALAELARHAPGTELVWAVRNDNLARVFGGGDADGLAARGQLGAALKSLRDSGRLEFVGGLRITAITREGEQLLVSGLGEHGSPIDMAGIDQIICATGQRPALAMTSELRLALDPALESTAALGELVDPNLHSCGSVRPHGHRELSHPEKDFYTVGVKSYGRAPTFLMMTGYEQARSVVAALAGDWAAADALQLELPETGVCSVTLSESSAADGGCCAPSTAAPAASNACRAPGLAPVSFSNSLTSKTDTGCDSRAESARVKHTHQEDIIMTTLSHRDRELVALGAALASNCVPCIEYHVPEARKAGLTDAEIGEAIALADKIRQVPANKVLASASAVLGAAAQSATGAACCTPDKVEATAQATGCCTPDKAQDMAQSMANASGCCTPAVAEKAAKSCC